MQAQKEYPVDFANCKDKFMVQVTELGVDEEIDAATTFSKEVKGDALRESRLRVVLEGPAAPPSPVPEGEEAGAATDAGGGALKTAFTDLAATSQENNYLKSKVEKLKGECDTLRRQLDAMQLAGAGKASSPASAKAKVSLIHIIIAAILAFLIGHYLGNR
ncbi:hypothetical protein FOA52_004792 [Chlamydomonas sp. UWO 241]|nr:hypothetical protein FOA52_004792 [Chlamydomonas sp. UWO 241]